MQAVPIQKAAAELQLNTHVIDTFTGWTPPTPVNIIIAVSFGLFVPPRILNLARYGGLNVHPSLLPDLRGPAPIHHALLKGRRFTGVSIQTLHPEHFDKGMILAQTPAPGIEVAPETTPLELIGTLAKAGANMLADTLRSRAFVPPLEDAGWYISSGGPIDHAGKITKQHRFIDFSKLTVRDILAIKRVLGDPWCMLPNGDRLILNEISESVIPLQTDGMRLLRREGSDLVLVRTACGGTLRIDRSTYEGGKPGGGNSRLSRLLEL